MKSIVFLTLTYTSRADQIRPFLMSGHIVTDDLKEISQTIDRLKMIAFFKGLRIQDMIVYQPSMVELMEELQEGPDGPCDFCEGYEPGCYNKTCERIV